MTNTEFLTCMDEVAENHARMQEQFEAQRKREMVRKAMREGYESMKENDEWFLRALISVWLEELGGLDGFRK